jgi:ubiquinone/menaquinone biosynthesis C-methylase UbiE
MYRKNPPWDTGVSPPELIKFIATHPAGTALDLGCGTGTNAITLAHKGWDTTGVDFVGKAIKVARKKAETAGVKVKFIIDDVAFLKKIRHQQFNLLLDIGCFHNLSQMQKQNYVKNIERLLAPGGSFLIYAWLAEPNKKTTGMTKEDFQAFSKILKLINREDGFEGEVRPSVWLTYEKHR